MNFFQAKETMNSLRTRTASLVKRAKDTATSATTTTESSDPPPAPATTSEEATKTSPLSEESGKEGKEINNMSDHQSSSQFDTSDHRGGGGASVDDQSDIGSIVASVMSSTDFFHDDHDEIQSDPEILHLTKEIRTARQELRRLKQTGLNTQRRRTNNDVKTLTQKKNSKSRELWMKNQGFKHNFLRGYLTEYKSEVMKCSLPSHDTSDKTLNAEAKLCRQHHVQHIQDQQMVIVQSMQAGMIDYMYNHALPSIKEEHELAKLVGQSQVDKARKSKDEICDLYESCLGLQRKIIAKYRLREIEHQNEEQQNDQHHHDVVVDGSELEAIKVAAGDVPTMERVPELRDSAKARMEARKAAKERVANRKKKVEEIDKNVDDIVEQEKAALDRVNKHDLTLSDHSVDLLNKGLDDLSSASDRDEFGEGTTKTKNDDGSSSNMQQQEGDDSAIISTSLRSPASSTRRPAVASPNSRRSEESLAARRRALRARLAKDKEGGGDGDSHSGSAQNQSVDSASRTQDDESSARDESSNKSPTRSTPTSGRRGRVSIRGKTSGGPRPTKATATGTPGNVSLARLRALRAARDNKDDGGSDSQSASKSAASSHSSVATRAKLRAGSKTEAVGSGGETASNTTRSTKDESSSHGSHTDNNGVVEETKPANDDKSNKYETPPQKDDEKIEVGAGEKANDTKQTAASASGRMRSRASAGGSRLGSRPSTQISRGGRGAANRTDILERARSARQLSSNESKPAASSSGVSGKASSSRDATDSGGLKRIKSVTDPDERQARLERLRNRAGASAGTSRLDTSSRSRGSAKDSATNSASVGGGRKGKLSASRRAELRKGGGALGGATSKHINDESETSDR